MKLRIWSVVGALLLLAGTCRLWGGTPVSRLVGDAGNDCGQLDHPRSSVSNGGG